ncbi:MAG: alkene reductase [Acidobacteria bacterium]|jgi:N-ethylmaleimide reductase|nr:alkene reductase [Acidobacteriota bacterium]
MTKLFDALKIGNLELKNRIIVAPMTRSRADDAGVQTEIVTEYYRQRATAGLIITEATNVSAMAKGYVRTPGIYTVEQIESWRKVADAVHARGGKIFMQLFHTGRISLPDFLPNNAAPVAPSAVKANGENKTDGGPKDFVEPREMTAPEIKQTVKDFAEAAKNAIAAGFDGVELHAANGYLVHQFLGTNTNLRADEYGGSFENRARFLFEVVDAISGAIGSERLGVKLSPTVPFNDMQDADAEEFYPFIVRELNKKNLAYLHVGFEETPAMQINWHEKLRTIYKGIYFANGGFTRESGEKFLAENKADAIAYGKLFIANPDLPERFRENAPLNNLDDSSFYATGEKGYSDYPTLEQSATA